MLNYISAELYKLRHQTFLYVFLGLALTGSALTMFLWIWDFEYFLSAVSAAFLVGFYLVIFLNDLVCADSGRKGPLKNEAAFGLSRARVYLGKLAAAALLSFALCAALLIFSLGLGRLLSPAGDPAAETAALRRFGFQLAAVLPLWLGTLGIYHCLRMLLGSSAAVPGVFAAGIVLTQTLVLIRWQDIFGPFGTAIDRLLGALPFCFWSAFPVQEHMRALIPYWLDGLGWFAAASAAGCLLFRRLEL